MKTTETQVVFDTMLYRKIGAALKFMNESQKQAFIQAFIQAEKQLYFEPRLSILVVLELLKHLKTKSDSAYSICKEGLIFAMAHTDNRILLPPTLHFAEKFFNTTEPYTLFLEQLKNVLKEIAESKGSDEQIKKLNSEIKWLTGQFFDLVDNNLFIKTNDVVPIISKKDKKLSLHLFLNEKEKDYQRQADTFLTQLIVLLKIETPDILPQHIAYLTQNYRATLEKFRIFTLKIRNNDMPKHRQANDISDALIMMGLNPEENTMLVTAEKANIAIIHKVGLKDWVISQDDYFKKVNIEGIKKDVFI